MSLTTELPRGFNQGVLLSVRLQFQGIGDLAHRIASAACRRDASFVVLNDVCQFVGEDSIRVGASGRCAATGHVDIASFGKRLGL
jgi:hypothetical protein